MFEIEKELARDRDRVQMELSNRNKEAKNNDQIEIIFSLEQKVDVLQQELQLEQEAVTHDHNLSQDLKRT